jgi:hypothetical protein
METKQQELSLKTNLFLELLDSRPARPEKYSTSAESRNGGTNLKNLGGYNSFIKDLIFSLNQQGTYYNQKKDRDMKLYLYDLKKSIRVVNAAFYETVNEMKKTESRDTSYVVSFIKSLVTPVLENNSFKDYYKDYKIDQLNLRKGVERSITSFFETQEAKNPISLQQGSPRKVKPEIDSPSDMVKKETKETKEFESPPDITGAMDTEEDAVGTSQPVTDPVLQTAAGEATVIEGATENPEGAGAGLAGVSESLIEPSANTQIVVEAMKSAAATGPEAATGQEEEGMQEEKTSQEDMSEEPSDPTADQEAARKFQTHFDEGEPGGETMKRVEKRERKAKTDIKIYKTYESMNERIKKRVKDKFDLFVPDTVFSEAESQEGDEKENLTKELIKYGDMLNKFRTRASKDPMIEIVNEEFVVMNGELDEILMKAKEEEDAHGVASDAGDGVESGVGDGDEAGKDDDMEEVTLKPDASVDSLSKKPDNPMKRLLAGPNHEGNDGGIPKKPKFEDPPDLPDEFLWSHQIAESPKILLKGKEENLFWNRSDRKKDGYGSMLKVPAATLAVTGLGPAKEDEEEELVFRLGKEKMLGGIGEKPIILDKTMEGVPFLSYHGENPNKKFPIITIRNKKLESLLPTSVKKKIGTFFHLNPEDSKYYVDILDKLTPEKFIQAKAFSTGCAGAYPDTFTVTPHRETAYESLTSRQRSDILLHYLEAQMALQFLVEQYKAGREIPSGGGVGTGEEDRQPEQEEEERPTGSLEDAERVATQNTEAYNRTQEGETFLQTAVRNQTDAQTLGDAKQQEEGPKNPKRQL